MSALIVPFLFTETIFLLLVVHFTEVALSCVLFAYALKVYVLLFCKDNDFLLKLRVAFFTVILKRQVLFLYLTEIVVVPFLEATILPFFTVAIFLLLVLYLIPLFTVLLLYFTVIGVLLLLLSPTYSVVFGTVTATLPDLVVAACTGIMLIHNVRMSDSTKINDRFFLLVFIISAPFDSLLIILLKYTYVNFKHLCDNAISYSKFYHHIKRNGIFYMIADKIKILRTAQNLSQADLAKKLGITRSSVNAWELGFSCPSTNYLVELANLFHVSTDYLLGLKQNGSLDISGLNTEQMKILYELTEHFRKENKK